MRIKRRDIKRANSITRKLRNYHSLFKSFKNMLIFNRWSNLLMRWKRERIPRFVETLRNVPATAVLDLAQIIIIIIMITILYMYSSLLGQRRLSFVYLKRTPYGDDDKMHTHSYPIELDYFFNFFFFCQSTYMLFKCASHVHEWIFHLSVYYIYIYIVYYIYIYVQQKRLLLRWYHT